MSYKEDLLELVSKYQNEISNMTSNIDELDERGKSIILQMISIEKQFVYRMNKDISKIINKNDCKKGE